MAVPNPTVYIPFDILTAEQLNEQIENDVALAAGTALDAGAITTSTLAESAVTKSKIDLPTLGLFGATIIPPYDPTKTSSVTTIDTGLKFNSKSLKMHYRCISETAGTTYALLGSTVDFSAAVASVSDIASVNVGGLMGGDYFVMGSDISSVQLLSCKVRSTRLVEVWGRTSVGSVSAQLTIVIFTLT